MTFSDSSKGRIGMRRFPNRGAKPVHTFFQTSDICYRCCKTSSS